MEKALTLDSPTSISQLSNLPFQGKVKIRTDLHVLKILIFQLKKVNRLKIILKHVIQSPAAIQSDLKIYELNT
jgi:hypothetical protein